MRWLFSLYALFGFVLGTHTHTVTLEQVSAVINQITSIIRQIPVMKDRHQPRLVLDLK